MNVEVTMYDKVVMLGPFERVELNGCALQGDGITILTMSKYEEGYCESCYSTSAGVYLDSEALAVAVSGKQKPQYQDRELPTAHIKLRFLS